MVSFNNTEIAFSDADNNQLKRARFLFSVIRFSFLVKTGSVLLSLASKLGIPLHWFMKKSFYRQFCGGETLEECQGTIDRLAAKNIKTVLDYAAEGVQNEKGFEDVKKRIISGIHLSKNNPAIAFAVFKFSGIARFELLEKVNYGDSLNDLEKEELDRVKKRADDICQAAVAHNLPVMIDAEESWIQQAIDGITEGLMEKYNRNHPFVYNTLQLYRIDKLYYLKQTHKKALEMGYYPAFKLVRGAYLEKERDRAVRYGYNSPIYPDKQSTDRAFDDAVKFCLEKIHNTAVCIGTHNEESCLEAIYHMDNFDILKNHPGVSFSQLMGMSDHISYNLARENYNVAKYVPYGPVNLVIPYLIRRAEENTSVTGQTGRELYLIRKELQRRKSLVGN